jgi:serine/threonine protein kinase
MEFDGATEMLLRMRHPNIQALMDNGANAPTEEPLASFETLEKKIATSDIKVVAPQLLSALHHMAVRSIMHLSINLTTIVHATKDHILLTGFDKAKLEEEKVDPFSGDNSLFIAPEYLRTQPSVKSDVFSAGVVLLCVEKKAAPFALGEVSQRTAFNMPSKTYIKQMLTVEYRHRISAQVALTLYGKSSDAKRNIYHPCPEFQAAVDLIGSFDYTEQEEGWDKLKALPGTPFPFPHHQSRVSLFVLPGADTPSTHSQWQTMIPCLLSLITDKYEGAIGVEVPLLAALRAITHAATLPNCGDIFGIVGAEGMTTHLAPFLPFLIEIEPPIARTLLTAAGAYISFPPWAINLLKANDKELESTKRRCEEAETENRAVKAKFETVRALFASP